MICFMKAQSHLYLILQIQLGAGASAVKGFLPEPLRPNFQPAATGGTACRPRRPIAELTVQGARDVTNLHDVAYN